MRIQASCAFLAQSATSWALRQPYDYILGLKTFQDEFLNPGPIVQVGESPILSNDVVGRVDITTTFAGQELNTEYLYGLWYETTQQANETSLIGSPISQTLQSLVVQPPVVFVSTITELSYLTIDFILLVQIDTILRFDDDIKVVSYNVTFRRWPAAWKFLLPKLAPQLAKEAGVPYDASTANTTQLLLQKVATDVRPVAMEYCIGDNFQYSSYGDCFTFITESLPFGDVWEGGLDNAWCRYVHKNMVKVRPNVHCTHIGPTGGYMCISRSYVDIVLDVPFNGTLVAPNATIIQSDTVEMSQHTFDEVARTQLDLVYLTTVAFVLPNPAMIIFSILYISAKATEFALTTRSTVFRDEMTFANQRNTVTYIINTIYTIVALISQLFASASVGEKYTYVGAQCVKLTALLVSELYLFELCYRSSMRFSLLAHQFFTLLAIISLFVNLQLAGHLAGMTLGYIWLFQATTEQSIFVGLALYRLQYSKLMTRKVLQFAAIQSFVVKLASTICLFIWWVLKLSHYTQPADIFISVIVCIVGTLLLTTLAYGSWAVWAISRKLVHEEEETTLSNGSPATNWDPVVGRRRGSPGRDSEKDAQTGTVGPSSTVSSVIQRLSVVG